MSISALPAGKAAGLRRTSPRAWICLAVVAVLLAVGIVVRLQSGDTARITELTAQASALTSAQEQLDTLQTRFERRETQLAEAKAALEAAPDDESLLSKLDRAQGEYDKALRNRDQQLAKVEAMPSIETINGEINDLKESSARNALLANAMMLVAILAAALGIAYLVRTADGKVLLGIGGLALAGVLIVAAIYRNDLHPVTAAGQTAPGTAMIAVGIGMAALAHILYWCFLTKARVDFKMGLGAVLVSVAGGLFIVGLLKNNAPDAASKYINSMSPGFMNIFVGAVLLIVGSLILALPMTRIRYDLRKNPMLMLMALPSIIYFLITSYLPMVGVYFAFTSYQFTKDFFSTLFGSKFVGLSNFAYLFSSGLAWRMTFNTVVYNFIFIVGGTVLKVAIAIMFSEIAGKYYKKFVQTATFLPHFISMVMVGTFAYNILNYSSGILNNALVHLGLERIDVYSIPGAWYVILPLVDFWKGVGYGSIIYVSAITGISDELYEAADLDGANFMQEIRHITIPSIRPTIIILTLMSLGSIMKGNFDLFYQLVGESGQLMETTEIIDTYVWRSLRQNVQIGMGSAAGLYQSFVGMVLVVLVNTIVKKIEPDYAIF